MKYNEAKDVNWQSLAIEDAQARILLLCKKAAQELWSRERMRREILNLIRELIGDLESEMLKNRVAVPLMQYGEKTYINQVRLLRENALFFVVVASALAERREVPDAQAFMATIKTEFAPPYRETPGFKYWSSEASKEAHLYNKAVPLGEYHKTYTARVRELTHELVSSEAKEDYDINVNLRNVAEMTVRYEHQQNMLSELRKNGTKLVYIPAHANASERCAKYQVGGSSHPSGLYSLDGTTGETPEGIKYVPLEFATENIADRHTTRRGKTYQNGCITGFNCRHKLEPYRPGVKPYEIPKEVVERVRKLEEKQREYERKIRLHKQLYVQLKGDKPREAKLHKLAAERLNERYVNFSRKNKMAFYRERTRIFDNL